jgi:ankyrin repeat protein
MNYSCFNNMNNHLCETLHQALRDGHLECITTLLDQGADVNESFSEINDGLTLLHLATRFGHSNCVRILLDYGANVNVKYTGTNEKVFYK